jgi:CBS domain-containing protein
MSSPVVTIDAMSPAEFDADIMTQNGVRHLLVVKEDEIGKPLGIISASDLARYLTEKTRCG